MSWVGFTMGGGCHHERPARIERVKSVDAWATLEGDAEWILAAAMLDTMVDDLAITHAAGWWRTEAQEMRGKCAEADALLAELESSRVQGLHDLVRAATQGRVQMGTGWMMRLARTRAASMRKNRLLNFALVQSALRLPVTVKSEKWTDMPPVRLPDGRFNPAYQRERARRMKARGLCRDCKTELPTGYGGTRCMGCREDHARRVRELEGYKVEPPPAGAVPFKTWIGALAKELGKSIKTVRWYLAHGKLPWPPMHKMSQRQWWVCPAGIEAEAGRGARAPLQGERRAA